MGYAADNDLIPFQITYVWDAEDSLSTNSSLNPTTVPCNEAYDVSFTSVKLFHSDYVD